MVAVTKEKTALDSGSVIYPEYSREEKLADGAIHILGIFGSMAAFATLFGQTYLNPQLILPLTVYAGCVIALFCFSAAYHMTPWPHLRPVLRRFDQSAIYFKIAGTYTPLVFLIATTFSYSLLAAIWLAATLGALAKLVTGDRLDKHTIVIYLALGWSSVLLLWPLFHILPFIDIVLVLLGGALYTIGIYYHQAVHIKYSNAVWHGFVLAASICHFIAIADAATR